MKAMPQETHIQGSKLLLLLHLGTALSNLLGSSDVQFPQLGLEVGVDLQVEERLADALLDLVGLLVVHLDDLASCYASHGDF